jgi:hypothetical protein
LAAAAAIAIAIGVSTAGADTTKPVFLVGTDEQVAGASTGVALYLQRISAAGAPGRISITVPNGYAMSSSAAGAQLGDTRMVVEPTAGGSKTVLEGSIVQVDAESLASDSAFATCVPGAHAGAWHLVLDGDKTLVVPVVLDQPATGGFQLTICLDAVRAAGLRADELDLWTRGVFTNPLDGGLFVWSALVSPFDTSGRLDAPTTYELRAEEPLPQSVTVTAAYTAKTRQLVVRGAVLANGRPRAGILVHAIGATSPTENAHELGTATTKANGDWILRVRTTKRPNIVVATVDFYAGPCVGQPSAAPAGCANESIDGSDSDIVDVKVVKPKPKPKPKH